MPHVSHAYSCLQDIVCHTVSSSTKSSCIAWLYCLTCMQAVGFDMDYTLSQYKPETFEKLAHDLTVQKLVSVFGYPEVSVRHI